MWGCDAVKRIDGTWENPASVPLQLDGEDQFACPRRPVKDDPLYFKRLMFFYGLYQKGTLPDSGGVMDQSERGLTLLRLVENIESEAEKELRERQQKKAARAKR